MPDGPSIRCVLQSVVGWAALAAGCGITAGNVGAGGEWDVLCRYVNPHTEPRADAAAAAAAHLDSGRGLHGDGHNGYPHRRVFAGEPHKISGRILRHLYGRMFPAV